MLLLTFRVPSTWNLIILMFILMTVTGRALPHGRVDYQILHDGKHLGVIEAKAIYTFSHSALAQAIMELLQLECVPNKHKTHRFGVLTDGYQYLFYTVSEEQLEISAVYRCDTWAQLEEVAEMFFFQLTRPENIYFN